MRRICAWTAVFFLIAALWTNGLAAEIEPLAYQGKITLAMQTYSPDEENRLLAMRRLAEQWEALHPEIQLEFLPKVSFSDYTTWLKTKMAGGMAPDIFWALWTQLDVGAYPAGCAVQLNDFFQKPNPYVEGNKQWKDLFFPAIYERTGGSSGRQWSVVGDYVGTSVYYNKSMFRAAGIDMDALQGSVTWSEYREICQKLSAAGFVPWSFAFGSDTICTNRTWLQRLILTNLYAEIWDEICFTNPIQPNVIDAYVAFRNGLIGPRSPRWMSMWPMIKEMVDHWMPEDCVSSGCTFDSVFAQFIQGHLAMQWNTSGSTGAYDPDTLGFEVGSFSFPIPDRQSNPYASDYDSSASVGGPNGSFQYAISTPQSDYLMTEEKLLACVDFLMYLTVPENNAAICNEIRGNIPAIVGAEPLEGNRTLSALVNAPIRAFHGGQECSAELTEATYRIFQEYLRGNITLEEASGVLNPIWEQQFALIYDHYTTEIAPYLSRIKQSNDGSGGATP